MNQDRENVGYKKILKGVLITAAVFFVMLLILVKAEKRDQEIRKQTVILTPVATPLTTEHKKPDVILYKYTPEQLHNEFKENEVRVTQKLSGNVLSLKGTVSEIGLSLGKPVISILIPNSDDVIKVFFDKNLAERISELNVGDVVLVGSGDVSLNPFGTIHLRSTSLYWSTNK